MLSFTGRECQKVRMMARMMIWVLFVFRSPIMVHEPAQGDKKPRMMLGWSKMLHCLGLLDREIRPEFLFFFFLVIPTDHPNC